MIKNKWKTVKLIDLGPPHTSYLLSPPSPGQISYRKLPRLSVPLSSPLLALLWCPHKYLEVSFLDLAIKNQSFLINTYLLFTIVLENRVTAKVEADDSNNDKIPKNIWIKKHYIYKIYTSLFNYMKYLSTITSPLPESPLHMSPDWLEAQIWTFPSSSIWGPGHLFVRSPSNVS